MSRRLIPLLFAIIVGNVTIGFGGGWWLSNTAQQQQLRSLTDQHQQALTSIQQQLASTSADLKTSQERIAGFEQYVVQHTSQPVEAKYLRGYAWPIDGVGPQYGSAGTLPGAARLYRGGIHEGIDFWSGSTPKGTPVKAVGDAKVIRVDRDHQNLDSATISQYTNLTQQIDFTPEHILDDFRGRQVWLLLPGNVIVRYCHLDRVADISLGQSIKSGTVVGYMGNSGTIDQAVHLHLEVRVGNTYLGRGQSGAALTATYQRFFDRSGK
jgi:murein DD-endopeptidase MepM/ murein hydrolase activator NlpD